MRKGLIVLFLLCAAGAAAEEPKLRTFAGGFSTRWKTRGHHGHDQDDRCLRPMPQYSFCDYMDFNRGNLDNSIGYRLGMERDYVRAGMLRLLGGADTSVSYSEYNISQGDLMFFNGTVNAGADLAHGGFRLGGRYGVGAYVASSRDYGVQWFHELVASAPLRSGASVRVSRRYMHNTRGISRYGSNFYPLDGPIEVTETSVMFVASPDVRDTKWEYSASSGMSSPGGGTIGEDRYLKQAGWHRLTAARTLPWKLEARANWTAFAHESWIHTDFRGFPGNERSKTVDAFGVSLWRKQPLGETFSLHYGLGMEVADWRDDHHLLLDHGLDDVVGGVETGGVVGTALRMRLGRGTALEATAEQSYWTGIRLGETRWGVGLVLTR
jgi:hypothetical protein